MFSEYIILDTYQAESELENITELGDIVDEEIVRERVQKILTEVEAAQTKLKELKRKCENALMAAKKPKETIEEIREEFAEMEEKAKKQGSVKLIPEKEAVTVALSKLPSATPKIKERARKVIEKYGLTEEEVDRLYKYFFEGE